MQWHPDNFQNEEEKKKAEKKFIDIAAAKEVLSDPGMAPFSAVSASLLLKWPNRRRQRPSGRGRQAGLRTGLGPAVSAVPFPSALVRLRARRFAVRRPGG